MLKVQRYRLQDNLKEPLKNSVTTFVQRESFQQITQDENSSLELREVVAFGVKEFLKERQIPTKLPQILRKDIEEASVEADQSYMHKINITVREYIELKAQELSNQCFALESVNDGNKFGKVFKLKWI